MIFLLLPKMERRKTLLYFSGSMLDHVVRSRERSRKRKKEGEETIRVRNGEREEQNERGAKDERG